MSLPRLTKATVAASSGDAHTIDVPVPEWGGIISIRMMSVQERDAHELEWLNNKEKGVDNFRAKFLARCLCDENGVRLFSDADAAMLGLKGANVMNRLWAKAMAHNALTEADVQELAGE